MWKNLKNLGRVKSIEKVSSKKYYNQKLGAFGEEQAARYLRKKGYRIEARNVRTRAGELDILAWDGDELVFAEVKTRTNTVDFLPCEAVNYQKQQHIKAAAQFYLQKSNVDANCRFDVIEVYADVKNGIFRVDSINHLADAFE